MPPDTVTPTNPTQEPTRKAPKTPRNRTRKGQKTRSSQTPIPRALSGFDDDVLLSGGSVRGQGFGRCGGRILGSKLEQQICDLLSGVGLTHSHAPRHFEVPLGEDKVAAYAPMIVLRGRGRGGKIVVIEAADRIDPVLLDKIVAFRGRFGSEFYLVFVAPEELLDLIPMAAYDECSTTTDTGTLINRLAD